MIMDGTFGTLRNISSCSALGRANYGLGVNWNVGTLLFFLLGNGRKRAGVYVNTGRIRAKDVPVCQKHCSPRQPGFAAEHYECSGMCQAFHLTSVLANTRHTGRRGA